VVAKNLVVLLRTGRFRREGRLDPGKDRAPQRLDIPGLNRVLTLLPGRWVVLQLWRTLLEERLVEQGADFIVRRWLPIRADMIFDNREATQGGDKRTRANREFRHLANESASGFGAVGTKILCVFIHR